MRGNNHPLRVKSQPVELTCTEFNLLEAFMGNSGYTLTRDDLLEKAMGYAYEGMRRAADRMKRSGSDAGNDGWADRSARDGKGAVFH